jgi:hypothetical protein
MIGEQNILFRVEAIVMDFNELVHAPCAKVQLGAAFFALMQTLKTARERKQL